MANILRRRGWEIPEREATPESVYLERRRFLKTLGLAGASLALGGAFAGADRALAAARAAGAGAPKAAPAAKALYPAKRNPQFKLDRPLTDEKVAAAYNNYYEFTEQKENVIKVVDKFKPRPWTVEIAGLVSKPRTIDVDQLIRALPAEERLYRHRCVEAWAMAVPWTGIPMRAFVKWAQPLSSAKYVRTVSFLRPDEAPNQAHATWYKWPYYEGLRLDEATNELALVTFGIYGHDLPTQHGAPLRIVTPWKYGYKSAKGIVKFEFTDKQPATFWHDVAPDEYGFLSNVNPKVPHPRWSQATEHMIGTGEIRPTQAYNGYAAWAMEMYDEKSRTFRS